MEDTQIPNIDTLILNSSAGIAEPEQIEQKIERILSPLEKY